MERWYIFFWGRGTILSVFFQMPPKKIQNHQKSDQDLLFLMKLDYFLLFLVSISCYFQNYLPFLDCRHFLAALLTRKLIGLMVNNSLKKVQILTHQISTLSRGTSLFFHKKNMENLEESWHHFVTNHRIKWAPTGVKWLKFMDIMSWLFRGAVSSKFCSKISTDL